MTVVLGLNCNHADSSACIIKDGKLIFAIEEERINRIKHWAGLPIQSIEECLKQSNVDCSEITDIALNTNPLSNIKEKTFFFIKNYLVGSKKREIANRIRKKITLKKDINNLLSSKKLSKNVKIHYIDHHISHIASAFYASNFGKAIGLSIDGFGDFCSLSISKCQNEKIEVIEKVFFPDSLGLFYEAFTQLVGFNNYGDEYKMMGLSSYGTPKYYDLISNEIFESENKIKLNLKYFNHTDKNFSYKFSGRPNQSKILNDKIKELVKIDKLSIDENITEEQKNLAASIQKIFEKKLILIIQKIKNLNFSENLVYAGGCALNSLGNKKIYDSKFFKNIFIPYAPGDGGGSIGAALIACKKIDKNVKFTNLQSPFVGPEFSNDFIKSKIQINSHLSKFKYEYFNNKDALFANIAKDIF
ncbi:MAG: carbamoyltransferase, partial [Pelagibacterales bacterium]|nr:carbamoyltransferase [Pelagibacterales bacterium]